ncbi:lipoprotein [Arthrobacter sp. SPG23]|nr:lipoprotein [Arthrobacter sp. SPG23]
MRGKLPGGTPVYFVAVDDGGSTGVRFGCNDSLVAVFHSTTAAEEPLQSALGILLGGGDPPDGLYNSLDDSTLSYVSAYFDGTTVVVNLTGTVRPGGTCDIPRLEAQLTHTAVSAVGAARAEIYVDGRRLAEALSLR